MTHPFDREQMRGVELIRHLAQEHGFHSSNEFEDDAARHRQLHGVPSAQEEAHQAELAKAWSEGYTAGANDTFQDMDRRYASGADAGFTDDEWTANPYTPADQPVDTPPSTDGNPDLWRTL